MFNVLKLTIVGKKKCLTEFFGKLAGLPSVEHTPNI